MRSAQTPALTQTVTTTRPLGARCIRLGWEGSALTIPIFLERVFRNLSRGRKAPLRMGSSTHWILLRLITRPKLRSPAISHHPPSNRPAQIGQFPIAVTKPVTCYIDPHLDCTFGCCGQLFHVLRISHQLTLVDRSCAPDSLTWFEIFSLEPCRAHSWFPPSCSVFGRQITYISFLVRINGGLPARKNLDGSASNGGFFPISRYPSRITRAVRKFSRSISSTSEPGQANHASISRRTGTALATIVRSSISATLKPA